MKLSIFFNLDFSGGEVDPLSSPPSLQPWWGKHVTTMLLSPPSPTQHNTVRNGLLQVEKEVATLVEDLEETLPKTEADTEAKE